MSTSRDLEVSIDQDACTGDGLCVQYAPTVFEFDIDGLAYVKDTDGELLTTPGSQVRVPEHLRLEIVNAAHDCPGECIYVRDRNDKSPVAGPGADD
ncbi:ferredoxin [Glycomyces terrestris]|uniref:Ferredoxin n=1 Tax=Glycomyces terrestris TaxID=2493553 RepID=A0A426UWJ1_9ACTN|nr:ferredoxin [Glycomyces terrestris]RRR98694.1 ferredoxin [Glycomyces terrestris]